jgi:hypothetical protein
MINNLKIKDNYTIILFICIVFTTVLGYLSSSRSVYGLPFTFLILFALSKEDFYKKNGKKIFFAFFLCLLSFFFHDLTSF